MNPVSICHGLSLGAAEAREVTTGLVTASGCVGGFLG
jgi:hypothetical protein